MTAPVNSVNRQTHVVHREQYGCDWVEATFRSRPEAEAYIERYYVSVGGRDDDWSLYIAEEATVVVTLPEPTEFRPDVRHAYWGPVRADDRRPEVMVESGLLYCHELGRQLTPSEARYLAGALLAAADVHEQWTQPATDLPA